MQLSKQSFLTSEICVWCSLYIESNISRLLFQNPSLLQLQTKLIFMVYYNQKYEVPFFGGIHRLNFYNKLLKAFLSNHWLITRNRWAKWSQGIMKWSVKVNEMLRWLMKWLVMKYRIVPMRNGQHMRGRVYAFEYHQQSPPIPMKSTTTVTASKCIVHRTCFFSFADKPSRWFVYYVCADCWEDTGSY